MREQPTNYYALATESAAGRWLLLAGLVCCLALIGFLMIRFPNLQDPLVFSLQSSGRAGQYPTQKRPCFCCLSSAF